MPCSTCGNWRTTLQASVYGRDSGFCLAIMTGGVGMDVNSALAIRVIPPERRVEIVTHGSFNCSLYRSVPMPAAPPPEAEIPAESTGLRTLAAFLNHLRTVDSPTPSIGDRVDDEQTLGIATPPAPPKEPEPPKPVHRRLRLRPIDPK